MESSIETNFSSNTDCTTSDSNLGPPSLLPTQTIPINKWNTQHTLEWLNRKLPAIYEAHRENFIQNEITGENLLGVSFNQACLDQLKILDKNLRDQLLNEISLLKIRNEYEFIKRFKSLTICTAKLQSSQCEKS